MEKNHLPAVQKMIDILLMGDRRHFSFLDVGCGNGYYLHHMFKSGAKRVLGIDPSVKFVYQFYAIKKYIEGNIPIDIIPLKDDDLPNDTDIFETVFSMGVLSHRNHQ